MTPQCDPAVQRAQRAGFPHQPQARGFGLDLKPIRQRRRRRQRLRLRTHRRRHPRTTRLSGPERVKARGYLHAVDYAKQRVRAAHRDHPSHVMSSSPHVAGCLRADHYARRIGVASRLAMLLNSTAPHWINPQSAWHRPANRDSIRTCIRVAGRRPSPRSTTSTPPLTGS